MYFSIKYLHVACATLTGTGFFLRGLLMIGESPLLRQRWIRTIPHINDSILLGAAIVLVVLTDQYPFVDAWVTAKILGLIVYIILGSIALKHGRTKQIRIVAWLVALAVFGNIVAVAVTKNPWGLLRAIGG